MRHMTVNARGQVLKILESCEGVWKNTSEIAESSGLTLLQVQSTLENYAWPRQDSGCVWTDGWELLVKGKAPGRGRPIYMSRKRVTI